MSKILNTWSPYLVVPDTLDDQEKWYLEQTVRLWNNCGLLDLLYDAGMRIEFSEEAPSEDSAKNPVRVLDRGETRICADLLKKLGGLCVVARSNIAPRCVVSSESYVAHAIGHHVERLLKPEIWQAITDSYQSHFAKLSAMAIDKSTGEETFAKGAAAERVFVCGQAARDAHEYWACCFDAFTLPDGNAFVLKSHPDIHALLTQLHSEPPAVLKSSESI